MINETELRKKYDIVSTTFSEGLAVVGINKGFYSQIYGYINEDGKEVIPCQFSGAQCFSEGLAAVRKDGKWGYINKEGYEVIPCQYEDWSWFSEGLAMVCKKSKYGIINKEGNEVVPCEYDSIEDFSEGLALVCKNDKYGYVNKEGKEVIGCKYDYAKSFAKGLAMVGVMGEFDEEEYESGRLKYGYIDKDGKYLIRGCRSVDQLNKALEDFKKLKEAEKLGEKEFCKAYLEIRSKNAKINRRKYLESLKEKDKDPFSQTEDDSFDL